MILPASNIIDLEPHPFSIDLSLRVSFLIVQVFLAVPLLEQILYACHRLMSMLKPFLVECFGCQSRHTKLRLRAADIVARRSHDAHDGKRDGQDDVDANQTYQRPQRCSLPARYNALSDDISLCGRHSVE